MKRTLKIALLLAVIMFAGYNFHLSNNETESMSEAVLLNVEALAQNETSSKCSGTIYVCLSELEKVKEEINRNCSGNFTGYFIVLHDCWYI